MRPVVHLEDAADYRGIAAEAALPVPVAEDAAPPARPCSSSAASKSRPSIGVTPNVSKKFDGDDAGRHALGLRAAEQDEPHRVELGDRVERAVCFA